MHTHRAWPPSRRPRSACAPRPPCRHSVPSHPPWRCRRACRGRRSGRAAGTQRWQLPGPPGPDGREPAGVGVPGRESRGWRRVAKACRDGRGLQAGGCANACRATPCLHAHSQQQHQQKGKGGAGRWASGQPAGNQGRPFGTDCSPICAPPSLLHPVAASPAHISNARTAARLPTPACVCCPSPQSQRMPNPCPALPCSSQHSMPTPRACPHGSPCSWPHAPL